MLKTIDYAEKQHLPGERLKKYDELCITREYWHKCLPTSGLQGKFSNPITLLSKLFAFYQVEQQATLFETPYGVWAPKYENRFTPALQMFGVFRTEPPQSQEFAMKTPYKVQLINGQFTMISCIIYMKEHWQACVRDPRNGEWFRILDSGTAQLLIGDIPAEIAGVTQTDPKRKEEKYGPGGAKYEPAAWIYVRTEGLSQFKQAEANPLTRDLEKNRRLFHNTRPVKDAQSDYVVFVQILEKLEKLALFDIQNDENLYAAQEFLYFDTNTWSDVNRSFGLAGFIISFLLGYTGVLPDAGQATKPIGPEPYNSEERKNSVIENVKMFRLAWESIRPIFIPLFKRLQMLSLDDWSSFTGYPKVNDSMKKWRVTMQNLAKVWQHISTLLKIAAVPPTDSAGQFVLLTDKQRVDFLDTYNAVWNMIT
jgi:hypothetical protein